MIPWNGYRSRLDRHARGPLIMYLKSTYLYYLVFAAADPAAMHAPLCTVHSVLIVPCSPIQKGHSWSQSLNKTHVAIR